MIRVTLERQPFISLSLSSGGGADHLIGKVPALLDRALPPALRDDRFNQPWPPGDLIAGIEVDGHDVVGYLGGTVDQSRLQVDGVLLEEVAGHGSVEARGEGLWSALQDAADRSEATEVELWGRPHRPWHDHLVVTHGLQQSRALHQLRCPLPIVVDVTPLATRPFVPGQDDEALVRINNRAFATHPDQGTMTVTSLAQAIEQPWFDPDGLRLYHHPDHPETLAGFCWTKIHQPLAPDQPALGEIYVIGVDPDFHGRGLGKPMTAAGLAWLADQGLTTGMLYVEADNDPALRTYERLGFTHHRTDRAWSGPLDRKPDQTR